MKEIKEKNPELESVEFEETEKMSKKKQVEKELDKIKAFHSKVLKEAENIIVSDEKKSCFTYICNTSGGTVLLPDFRALDVDPSSTKVFSIKAGQIINLLTMFEPIVINRNRSALLTAFDMKGLSGLSLITCVENGDVKFPINLNPGSLIKRAQEKGMDRIECGYNEFDERLEEDYEKERKYNEKIMKKAGVTTKGRKTQDEVMNDI